MLSVNDWIKLTILHKSIYIFIVKFSFDFVFARSEFVLFQILWQKIHDIMSILITQLLSTVQSAKEATLKKVLKLPMVKEKEAAFKSQWNK